MKNRILFVVLLLTVITQFNTSLYLPSFPSMTLFFHVTPGAIQFSMILGLIFFCFSVFVYGPFSDHYGRKKILSFGLVIFLIGLLTAIFSTKIVFLYIGFIFQGMGLGSVGSICPAMIRDTFSGKELIKTISDFFMIIAIIPLIAPVLGGYLSVFFNWQANFIFMFLFTLFSLILMISVIPETNVYTQKKHLTFKKIMSNYTYVLSSKKFIGAILLLTITNASVIVFLLIVPFLIQKELGYSPIACGWILFILSIGTLIGNIASRVISNIISMKTKIFFSIVLMQICAIALFCFSIFFLDIYSLTIPIFFFVIGFGFLSPNCATLGIESFPENSGVAGGMIVGIPQGGAGLLAVIITYFHVHNQIPLASFVLFATILLLLIYFLFHHHFQTCIVNKKNEIRKH
ncbi:MAG: MFS transporter [Parachlamydiales bacterium]|nr:MFS transporter [Parachlamydiales bacterium]